MRHLLDLNDLEMDIPRKIVDMAKVYKLQNKGLAQGAPLLGRTLGMIFEKPSTRTRVSFEVAMTELGGSAIFLDANSMQLGRGETIEDTARVLGRYIDGIMLRAIKHETLIQMSKYSEIPVINGLTDMSHPCQALADIMTFEENLGSIKGKKIAWIGDGNNVANSWLHASAIFGCELYLACPETRLPSKKAIEWAKNNGGNIEITQDPLSAAKNANAIITMTHSGYTAYKISSQRPKSSIFVFSRNKKLLSSLSLVWGVETFYYDKMVSTDDTIADIKTFLKNNSLVSKGDLIINTASMPIEEKGKTNMLKLSYID